MNQVACICSAQVRPPVNQPLSRLRHVRANLADTLSRGQRRCISQASRIASQIALASPSRSACTFR
jgi:hypothetical protein